MADGDVRYRVKKICQVNDALVDPRDTEFVWARPGLEGSALELAAQPKKKAAAKDAAEAVPEYSLNPAKD